MSQNQPDIVLFLNDWPVRPAGANSGGGEIATVSLARAFRKLQPNVYVCGNLPEGDCEIDDVKYIDFGKRYELHRAIAKLTHLRSFYCFAATLAHPFLLLREDPRCLAKILINHSPGIVSSGLEPATVMEIVNYMACVSQAQRSIIMSRGPLPQDRVVIVKNGFDPDLFKYSGPAGRNWNRLIYTGRLEPAKGIHILLESYQNLVREFPLLELRIFGDETYWPDLAQRLPTIIGQFPGISFFGKVPQARLATELREAGIQVFPSTSFETAGLSVIDAQGAGCPVVASAVGGVPEYLFANKCGRLFSPATSENLTVALRELLSNPAQLEQMSVNCEKVARGHTWQEAARQLLALAQKSAKAKAGECTVSQFNDPVLQRTLMPDSQPYSTLLEDHEAITNGSVISDAEIDRHLIENAGLAAPYLWKGLRAEQLGNRTGAIEHFYSALARADKSDWQPAFRLFLLHAEACNLEGAVPYAQRLILEHPYFPLREKMETLVAYSQSENAI